MSKPLLLLPVVLAGLFLRLCVLELVLVKGSSMRNTLRDGDIVLAQPRLLFRRRIKRGDIVICHYPGRKRRKFPRVKKNFIKRVIALPGEEIAFEEGSVLIDGEVLEEPYLDPERLGFPMNREPRKLGPDEYFVMGDNRRASSDSRSVGPIADREIIAVVKRRLLHTKA